MTEIKTASGPQSGESPFQLTPEFIGLGLDAIFKLWQASGYDVNDREGEALCRIIVHLENLLASTESESLADVAAKIIAAKDIEDKGSNERFPLIIASAVADLRRLAGYLASN